MAILVIGLSSRSLWTPEMSLRGGVDSQHGNLSARIRLSPAAMPTQETTTCSLRVGQTHKSRYCADAVSDASGPPRWWRTMEMGPVSALTTGAVSQSGREMLKSFQPTRLHSVYLPTTVHLTFSKSPLHPCPEGTVTQAQMTPIHEHNTHTR